MSFKTGLMVNLGDPAIIEMAGWVGYNFVWIDTEHTLVPHIGEMIRAAEAAGIEPWVRVPTNEASTIGQVLNLGATGIIVPHVNTPDDAARAVRNTKLHPQGLRNWFSKARDAKYGLVRGSHYTRARNAITKLIVQVEEPQAISSISEILDVPGIDLVVTGPGDLSHCLGVPGDLSDPRILEAEETVFAAADQRGIPVIHFANTVSELEALQRDHPVHYLVVASDSSGLLSFLQERLRDLTGDKPAISR